MNGILAAVPDGERWVMNSARTQLDKLSTPAVRKAARDFIRQERIHAREHDDMNAALVENGVPIDRVEAIFKLIRTSLQSRMSDDMQSSIAAAFEHFTATISSVMLENPELMDDTHPELRAMLFWHFVEETEHKGVSFDVFVDSVGDDYRGYLKRVGGMAMATVVGLPLMVGNHAYLLYKDKQLTNWRSALKMVDLLMYRPGILSRTLVHALAYYKPDFHPWDDDNRAVIHVWKKAFDKTGDTHKAFDVLRNSKHKLLTAISGQKKPAKKKKLAMKKEPTLQAV